MALVAGRHSRYFAKLSSGGSATQRRGAEHERGHNAARDDQGVDRELSAEVVRGRQDQRFVCIGQRQEVRDPLENVGHLVPRHQQPGEQDLAGRTPA
jgi:hypothetical protein